MIDIPPEFKNKGKRKFQLDNTARKAPTDSLQRREAVVLGSDKIEKIYRLLPKNRFLFLGLQKLQNGLPQILLSPAFPFLPCPCYRIAFLSTECLYRRYADFNILPLAIWNIAVSGKDFINSLLDRSSSFADPGKFILKNRHQQN